MNTTLISKNYTKLSLILLSYVAFIALGMPDGLLGIAWPSMRTDFSIPLDALGLLLFASTTGYISSSFLSGALIARLGVGSLLTVSCLLTGAALVGYTIVPVWWMVILLGLMAGFGAGAIDAGLNTYAASHFGEHLMQWLHASFGIGITIGPIIMTITITSLNSWRVGYWVVGSFQLLMATALFLTISWWRNYQDAADGDTPQMHLTDYKTPITETIRRPAVWVSILLFFLYVGTEISLGTWVYTLLTESRGMASQVAGFWASSYWGTFTVGRILAGLFARRMGIDTLVQGGVLLALLGAILLWWNPFQLANLLAIGIIGVAVAPIFPAMMSGTSSRVGPRFASNTIGMQIAGSGIGGAGIAGLLGVLARRFSLEIIPACLVMLLLMLFLSYRAAIVLKTKPENELGVFHFS